jgi:hypothetical protein
MTIRIKPRFSVINKKATINSLGDMHYITYRIPQFLKSLSPAEIEFLRPSLTFYPEIEANRKVFNSNIRASTRTSKSFQSFRLCQEQ